MPDFAPPFHSAPAAAAAPSDRAFLAGPMAALVDVLRVACALTVFVNHTQMWHIETVLPPVGALAAHYAVILFFVLSGLSIGSTAARPGACLHAYALARATRIVPVALLAVAVGSALFAARHDAAPLALDAPWQSLGWQAVVIPLLFLTEAPWGVTPVWNLPWWSLSYEVWYYALFGALVFLTGRRRVVVASLLALIAGPQILLLMPVWLAGVALAWFPAVCRIDRRAARWALAGAAALAWLAALVAMPALAWLQVHSPVPLVNSQNLVGDYLAGAAAALALAGLRPSLPLVPARLLALAGPPLRWAAGMSFTLYLFHGPLLNTLGSLGLVGFTRPLGSLAAMLGLLLACAVLAELGERRTPALRRWIERRLDRRPPAAAPAPLLAAA